MHEHEHEHHHHDHEHEHHHEHFEQNISPEKLLASMVEHNKGHFEELQAVADTLPEAAKDKLLAAVETLKQGNAMLEEALGQIKEA